MEWIWVRTSSLKLFKRTIANNSERDWLRGPEPIIDRKKTIHRPEWDKSFGCETDLTIQWAAACEHIWSGVH